LLYFLFKKAKLTVNDLSMVARDGLNQTLGFEFTNGNTGQRAVQLETIDKNRLGDELVSGDLLEQTVIGRLIEDDHVVGLVLDLLGGPLLLGFLTSRGVTGLGSSVFLCLINKLIKPSIHRHFTFNHNLRTIVWIRGGNKCYVLCSFVVYRLPLGCKPASLLLEEFIRIF
jgi:hypothetical protein